MPASFRPVWVWPLLAVPPAAAVLLLIAAPAVHVVLLLSGWWIDRWTSLYAPERTRRGARALAVAQRPQTSDLLEVLAWAVARDGPDALAGTAGERWSQIRASGADRRP